MEDASVSIVEQSPEVTLDHNRCSDYDVECNDITSWEHCYHGGIMEGKDGLLYYVAPADGYCPFLSWTKE